METKKITRATFKSFINHNKNNLKIRVESTFDGMVDGVRPCENRGFHPVRLSREYEEHTLGIEGIWLVGHSRDYFTLFEENGLKGIEVSNCCGCFAVAM